MSLSPVTRTLSLVARPESLGQAALKWTLVFGLVFGMVFGISLGFSPAALAAEPDGPSSGSSAGSSADSSADNAPATVDDDPDAEHVASDFLRVDSEEAAVQKSGATEPRSREPRSLFAELPDAALGSEQASSGSRPDATFRATCQNWGVSEWDDATPTYDPDGDLAFYSDARGAIMVAPLRVRAIADETIDRAPKPCGADAFAQALDNDRHSPEKTPPPLHVDPADLSRALEVPLSALLEKVDAPAPSALRSDEALRAIDRPPTLG